MPEILDRNPTLAQDFALKIEQRIARTLPRGKTYADALAKAGEFKKRLYTAPEFMSCSEDHRIVWFQALCTELCGGDKEAGRDLAEAAVWAS